LKASDITEIVRLKAPPKTLIMLAEVVCLIFGVKALMKINPAGGTKAKDFWTPFKGRI